METAEIKCDMKGKGTCPLPLENLLDAFKKKWSLSLIITIGNFGKLHFNAIRSKLKDQHAQKITSKILSARLKELEKSGLVKKEKYSDYPFMVKYSLTENGRRFYKTFLAFCDSYEKEE